MAAVDQAKEVSKNIKNCVYVKQDLANEEDNGNYESRRVQDRPRSIFEPDHLCQLEKICQDCCSTKNKFQYFNNNSVLQPQYKILELYQKVHILLIDYQVVHYLIQSLQLEHVISFTTY